MLVEMASHSQHADRFGAAMASAVAFFGRACPLLVDIEAHNRQPASRPEGRPAWMPVVFRPSHGWRVEKSAQLLRVTV